MVPRRSSSTYGEVMPSEPTKAGKDGGRLFFALDRSATPSCREILKSGAGFDLFFNDATVEYVDGATGVAGKTSVVRDHDNRRTCPV